jgi:hypothetical protein
MRRLLRPLLLLGLPCLAALGVPGCVEGERACYPSDWRACACADAAEGYQQCDAEGSGYGACDCSGTIPGFSGSPAPGTYMGSCTTDEDCTETKLCHPFNAKGPHCTLPCSADTDCPEPSPGCNNMGVCKAP